MRIAIFTETFLPKWDGVATTMCKLLDHLADRGHASLMFAPQGAPERYADTSIIGLPSVAFPLYRDLKLVPPLIDVRQQLADFKPDLVHLVNPASMCIAGQRHASALGVPTVASYHTDLPGYTKLYRVGLFQEIVWSYFRWAHNRANLNFCPSYFTKRELESHGFERIKVWPHGVDTNRFNPKHRSAEWRARFTGDDPDAQVLLYVGRLAAEKRVTWLRPLMDVLPKARLAIVGEGPMRRNLEKRFRGTNTVFTGYLKGQDLSAAYASADMFVFPSANETFGNVVLEAMASGLPVVAAGAGGPVDLVIDNFNGVLSDPDDPADFVARAWRCSTDVDNLQQMRAAALAFARSQQWDVILDALLNDYEQLLRETPKRKVVAKQPMQPRPYAQLFSSMLGALRGNHNQS